MEKAGDTEPSTHAKSTIPSICSSNLSNDMNSPMSVAAANGVSLVSPSRVVVVSQPDMGLKNAVISSVLDSTLGDTNLSENEKNSTPIQRNQSLNYVVEGLQARSIVGNSEHLNAESASVSSELNGSAATNSSSNLYSVGIDVQARRNTSPISISQLDNKIPISPTRSTEQWQASPPVQTNKRPLLPISDDNAQSANKGDALEVVRSSPSCTTMNEEPVSASTGENISATKNTTSIPNSMEVKEQAQSTRAVSPSLLDSNMSAPAELLTAQLETQSAQTNLYPEGIFPSGTAQNSIKDSLEVLGRSSSPNTVANTEPIVTLVEDGANLSTHTSSTLDAIDKVQMRENINPSSPSLLNGNITTLAESLVAISQRELPPQSHTQLHVLADGAPTTIDDNVSRSEKSPPSIAVVSGCKNITPHEGGSLVSQLSSEEALVSGTTTETSKLSVYTQPTPLHAIPLLESLASPDSSKNATRKDYLSSATSPHVLQPSRTRDTRVQTVVPATPLATPTTPSTSLHSSEKPMNVTTLPEQPKPSAVAGNAKTSSPAGNTRKGPALVPKRPPAPKPLPITTPKQLQKSRGSGMSLHGVGGNSSSAFGNSTLASSRKKQRIPEFQLQSRPEVRPLSQQQIQMRTQQIKDVEQPPKRICDKKVIDFFLKWNQWPPGYDHTVRPDKGIVERSQLMSERNRLIRQNASHANTNGSQASHSATQPLNQNVPQPPKSKTMTRPPSGMLASQPTSKSTSLPAPVKSLNVDNTTAGEGTSGQRQKENIQNVQMMLLLNQHFWLRREVYPERTDLVHLMTSHFIERGIDLNVGLVASDIIAPRQVDEAYVGVKAYTNTDKRIQVDTQQDGVDLSVDLVCLYCTVGVRGGYKTVSEKNLWNNVADELIQRDEFDPDVLHQTDTHKEIVLSSSCSELLRRYYLHYLWEFERTYGNAVFTVEPRHLPLVPLAVKQLREKPLLQLHTNVDGVHLNPSQVIGSGRDRHEKEYKRQRDDWLNAPSHSNKHGGVENIRENEGVKRIRLSEINPPGARPVMIERLVLCLQSGLLWETMYALNTLLVMTMEIPIKLDPSTGTDLLQALSSLLDTSVEIVVTPEMVSETVLKPHSQLTTPSVSPLQGSNVSSASKSSPQRHSIGSVKESTSGAGVNGKAKSVSSNTVLATTDPLCSQTGDALMNPHIPKFTPTKQTPFIKQKTAEGNTRTKTKNPKFQFNTTRVESTVEENISLRSWLLPVSSPTKTPKDHDPRSYNTYSNAAAHTHSPTDSSSHSLFGVCTIPRVGARWFPNSADFPGVNDEQCQLFNRHGEDHDLAREIINTVVTILQNLSHVPENAGKYFGIRRMIESLVLLLCAHQVIVEDTQFGVLLILSNIAYYIQLPLLQSNNISAHCVLENILQFAEKHAISPSSPAQKSVWAHVCLEAFVRLTFNTNNYDTFQTWPLDVRHRLCQWAIGQTLEESDLASRNSVLALMLLTNLASMPRMGRYLATFSGLVPTLIGIFTSGRGHLVRIERAAIALLQLAENPGNNTLISAYEDVFLDMAMDRSVAPGPRKFATDLLFTLTW
eukprot:CFRG7672T1